MNVFYCNMVMFSPDLRVIQDSIIRVSDKVARDYLELENLQSSKKGSIEFSKILVSSVKKRLFDYFQEKKPNYNIIFKGDEDNDLKISEFRYLINPISGIKNLIHAIPYFAISISLQQKNKDGEYETICGLIDNPITQETFAVESGRGSYVNSRRLRVSSRSDLSKSMSVIKDTNNKRFIVNCLKKYKNLSITNCEDLNVCNFASGKYDITILENKDIFTELLILLVKEAGGSIKNDESGNIIMSNGLLHHYI